MILLIETLFILYFVVGAGFALITFFFAKGEEAIFKVTIAVAIVFLWPFLLKSIRLREGWKSIFKKPTVKIFKD